MRESAKLVRVNSNSKIFIFVSFYTHAGKRVLIFVFSGIFGWFCPLCLFCKNANDLGENACLCCLFAMVCPTLAFCQLRQKARQKYGIEVSRFRAKKWEQII